MMESSSFSGSSKRAKAPGNISQVGCLVDGCNADLSLCRDYHRRHKVCEMHSKTAKVTIGGREQRFCQQCSRFHSLVEFDEGKRSCRKRLDGHNRRRRKPRQPDSLSRSQQQQVVQGGGRLVSFSSPTSQIILPSASSSSWVVKSDNEQQQLNNYMERQNSSFPEHRHQCSSHNSYIKGLNQQFQFIQDNNTSSGSSSTSNNNNNNSRHKMFSSSDGGSNNNQLVVVDSSDNRALSLLSSAAPSTVFGLNHNHHVVVQTDSSVIPSSLANNLHYSYPFAQESKPSSVDVSASATVHHFPEMFHQHGVLHEGSSTGSHHQTLSFMWE